MNSDFDLDVSEVSLGTLVTGVGAVGTKAPENTVRETPEGVNSGKRRFGELRFYS